MILASLGFGRLKKSVPLPINLFVSTRRLKKKSVNTEPDFKEIKRRFFTLNKERLRRTLAGLKDSQGDFLELLPLFFHVNHPMLPGYVSKDTAAGLPEYSPTQKTLRIARRISKSFTYKKRAYRKYPIHAIYLMGSTGTIAYSDKSDFDIWVCHDSEIKKDQLKALQAKVRGVEEWAHSQGIDANLFLVDAERFKKGEHDQLSGESSGSAIHYLLLEEFYRTSVLLAGRYPVWWLVPPGQEAQYEEIVADIKRKRYLHSKEHIDFGGLGHVFAEEFYGATLWLLYKGINSPYKSVLKILLMEAYASEYPQIDLLGMRFKKAVYEGEDSADKLDPYLMMLNKVEEYLKSRGEKERCELVRRSFYFKVNEKLSNTEGSGRSNWRRELISELVNSWGWTHMTMLALDSRNDWKIRRVIEERKALISEFTLSYRFLSDFARSRADSNNLIKPADLNVLGRKLYAAFERKAGKVEIVYKGITQDLFETHLSFHNHATEDGLDHWLVFSGVVPEEEAAITPPLKRAHCLMELVTWCFFNKMLNSRTVLSIYAEGGDLTEKELNFVIRTMEQLFGDDDLYQSTIQDYRQPARIIAVGSFINVGLDPFSVRTKRGEHLTTNRTDALRYGGQLENLALSIDQIIINSWQEVLTTRYVGIEGLLKCLREYILWSPPSLGKRPPKICAHSYSSYRGGAISRRIEEMFEDVISCYYDGGHSKETRYVLGIEWEYYVLHMKDDTLMYDRAGSIDELVDYLSMAQPVFRPVIFDGQTLSDSVLPAIFEYNLPNIVQCFYAIEGQEVTLYILDEKGSLFQQRQAYFDTSTLVSHLNQFLGSIHNRMKFFIQKGSAEAPLKDVRYYRIDKNQYGEYRIVGHTSNRLFAAPTYLNLQVIADRVDGQITFTLYCEGSEFSSLEFGDLLFDTVGHYIMLRRQSGEKYPIYISDIDLSKELLGSDAHSVQTVHYLKYKIMIEDKLNESCSGL